MLKDVQNEKVAEPAARKRVQKPTLQNWFEQGYDAQCNNRFEEACVCYSQVIELDKRYVPAYNNWAQSLLELAKMKRDENLFKRAFKKYTKAASLDPRNPLIWNNWAKALADYGKAMCNPAVFQEASKKYVRALRYAPHDAAIYDNWGMALSELALMTGRESVFLEAIEKYAIAAKFQPDYLPVYYKWANLLSRLAMLKKDEAVFQGAFEKYAKAVELQPDNALAYNDWGVALSDLAGIKEEDTLFEASYQKFAKAVELNPEWSAFYYNWGNALSAQGDIKGDTALFEEALTKYEKAMELQSDNAFIVYNYALAISDLAKLRGTLEQDAGKVEQLLKQVVALAGDTSAIYNLACLYALTGRKDDALQALKTALVNRHPITWQELEAEERKEKRESEDRSYNEIFAGTLLLGDSVSQGLYEFGIMNESLVIAQKGIGVCGVGRDGLKECEDRVISANPAKLFLAIGTNDLKAARGNADTFEEDYRSVLQEIEKALPDTEIYINSILPVQSKVIEENSDYGNIPEFNERLARLCEEEGAVFIDNTDLVKDEYYTADGIHMSPDYYPGWVDHMAEVAKL